MSVVEKCLPVRDTLETRVTTNKGEIIRVETFSPVSILQTILHDRTVIQNLQLPSLKGTLSDEPVLAGLPYEGRLAGTDPRFGPTRWNRIDGVCLW
jgi:hypothetical protein